MSPVTPRQPPRIVLSTRWRRPLMALAISIAAMSAGAPTVSAQDGPRPGFDDDTTLAGQSESVCHLRDNRMAVDDFGGGTTVLATPAAPANTNPPSVPT